MKWRIVGALLAGVFSSLMFAATVSAQGLEIRPTIYQELHLEKGEKKKGYVDVINSSAATQRISMSVQGFRQTDDSGALAFYSDERIEKGIKLDLDDFELGPHEAIRVFFLLDGALLPSGDVFAAVFARNTPSAGAAAQSVRVGTLLTVINGTPPAHTADVSAMSAPLFQVGEGITALISLTNPALESSATGFFPSLKVDTQPYTSRQVKGPLLFAGRTRAVEYRQPGNYFGVINLKVDAGGHTRSQFMFVATGYWRWLAPVLLIVAVAVVAVGRRFAFASRLRRALHR